MHKTGRADEGRWGDGEGGASLHIILPVLRSILGFSSYLGLNEASPQATDLLEVTEDIKDAVLFAKLDVGINYDVDAGPAGSITEEDKDDDISQ